MGNPLGLSGGTAGVEQIRKGVGRNRGRNAPGRTDAGQIRNVRAARPLGTGPTSGNVRTRPAPESSSMRRIRSSGKPFSAARTRFPPSARRASPQRRPGPVEYQGHGSVLPGLPAKDRLCDTVRPVAQLRVGYSRSTRLDGNTIGVPAGQSRRNRSRSCFKFRRRKSFIWILRTGPDPAAGGIVAREFIGTPQAQAVPDGISHLTVLCRTVSIQGLDCTLKARAVKGCHGCSGKRYTHARLGLFPSFDGRRSHGFEVPGRNVRVFRRHNTSLAAPRLCGRK